MLGSSALFLVGQSITGFAVYNDEQREHGETTIGYPDYLGIGTFHRSHVRELESEYLQMGAYVLFTVYLFQRGSSESKTPTKRNQSTRIRSKCRIVQTFLAGALRRPVLRLYEHSLATAFVLLFLVSFVLHAVSGARESSQEQLAHESQAVSTAEFLRTRVLVPVIPELAERGSWPSSRSWCCQSSCASAGLQVQARCCCARRDRECLSQS